MYPFWWRIFPPFQLPFRDPARAQVLQNSDATRFRVPHPHRSNCAVFLDLHVGHFAWRLDGENFVKHCTQIRLSIPRHYLRRPLHSICDAYPARLHRNPQFQVIWMVIASHTVLMMNVLVSVEVPTEYTFHHEDVLEYALV